MIDPFDENNIEDRLFYQQILNFNSTFESKYQEIKQAIYGNHIISPPIDIQSNYHIPNNVNMLAIPIIPIGVITEPTQYKTTYKENIPRRKVFQVKNNLTKEIKKNIFKIERNSKLEDKIDSCLEDSIYKGVFRGRDKWEVRLNVNGVMHIICGVDNEIEAARIYDYFAVRRGNVSLTNFYYSNEMISKIKEAHHYEIMKSFS
jgi:hypothetical protein